jgi:glycogen synthase
MTADFSWKRSAEAYLQLYRKALEKKRGEFPG